MILALLEAIFFIITLVVKLVFFVINLLRKLFIFLLTNSMLRFPFILFTLGYFLNTPLKILASIYFIYLTHKSAIKFNIYIKISKNIEIALQSYICNYKVSKALKALSPDYIVLNNLTVENHNDDYCTIDYLVISKSAIFLIRNLTYSNTLTFTLKNLRSKNNKDNIIDSEFVYNNINEINNSSNVLKEILPYDIPIINVIAISMNNIVIKYDKNYDTSIITVKMLSKFIQNNVKFQNTYDPRLTKKLIIENKIWIFDKIFSKTYSFLSNNKGLIGFLFLYLILYYLYINLIIILSA